MGTQKEKMELLGYKSETPYERMKRKQEEAKKRVLNGRKERVFRYEITAEEQKDMKERYLLKKEKVEVDD